MSHAALRLGSRGSRLALWQAGWVREALARNGVACDIVVIKTRGDAEVDRPLQQLEGKGFFTKEIEDALLAGRIDVAVHSLKDLPTNLPEGLALAAVPPRADPTEVLVARDPSVRSLADLTTGARVGTSSVRRSAQLRYARADLAVAPLRGNVPTRVAKVRGDESDGLAAAVLAGAGLERLGLSSEAAARLDPLEIMPAPGQGALGLEIRADDDRVRATLGPLEHPESARQVAAERALLRAIEGGCQSAVAAYVGKQDAGSGMRLYGRVTALDGAVQLTASAPIDPAAPGASGAAVARLLLDQGAGRLLVS